SFMKTILVATDFSPAATSAANYAAEMALVINAEVLLLHVYQIPVGYPEVPLPVSLEDMQIGADKQITELKVQLSKKTNNKLRIATEVRMGSFFKELKNVCESVAPYAVIIGSQGTTAAEHLFFGSNTVHAMKHLVWPLITVPNGLIFSAIKKIGIACDFEKVVDTIPVDEIKMLVHDFNAELHILNTGSEKEFKPELIPESRSLQEMLGALKPNFHFITNENTDLGIIDFAEKNHIDLLIVFPKRHSLLDKIMHKSHTKQLVLHTYVPVMALHQ
ncbi:MAG TPA: universal stress protein, partial [Chitinophagaceae bacterium]|nr:universal stress protein [Chitinophagaceae bacterium]